MRWYKKPVSLEGIIFDMDNTLYSHPEYTRHQEEVLVERLAHERRETLETTQAQLEEVRRVFSLQHGGRKPSLGNAFLSLGIPMELSIQWRRECIKPEAYLKADQVLEGVLISLSKKWPLMVITNNPVLIAQRTFDALGVPWDRGRGGVFTAMVGLDTHGVSKPNPRAFEDAPRLLGCPAQGVLSIGDRFEVDIEPALGLGMGGLLIEHVREMYSLEGELGGLSHGLN